MSHKTERHKKTTKKISPECREEGKKQTTHLYRHENLKKKKETKDTWHGWHETNVFSRMFHTIYNGFTVWCNVKSIQSNHACYGTCRKTKEDRLKITNKTCNWFIFSWDSICCCMCNPENLNSKQIPPSVANQFKLLLSLSSIINNIKTGFQFKSIEFWVPVFLEIRLGLSMKSLCRFLNAFMNCIGIYNSNWDLVFSMQTNRP